MIGFNEVEEINRKLRRIEAPRPLTHDLIGRILQTLEWQLVNVVISELRESTFYANLILRNDSGEEKTVDSRPSDAIALAVQTGASIYVVKDVFDMVALD